MSVLLPHDSHLPVSALAAAFDEVTNSYKFYWFLAILESVQRDEDRVLPLDLLLARMVASVWYPINYFRLSFGKQDQLGKVVELVRQQTQLAMNSSRQRVLQVASDLLRKRDPIGREILSLGEYVPYRFLRPFFAQTLRGVKDWEVNHRIRQLAAQSFSSSQPCLYRFVNTPVLGIEVHQDWYLYLREHSAIATGFCLWHLVSYLQRNNPNVPGVAGKLFEPQQRDLSIARKFWSLAIKQLGTVRCIYSGQLLPEKGFSIDHFLPWRFVAHDLLWNLVPTFKSVNSSKGDSLPHPDYIERLAKLHFRAIQAVGRVKRSPVLFEDYVMLTGVSTIEDLFRVELDRFVDLMRSTLSPQIQIAKNMGFSSGWILDRQV